MEILGHSSCLSFFSIQVAGSRPSLPHCLVFVYGSEVEHCHVCNCYWFADCVTTWFAESRTKAVSPPLKLRPCALGGGRGEGDAWMAFV